MSKTAIVRCSQGHRFPVNPKKNTSRDHVFCPRCREKVKVRSRWTFLPNSNWEKQKEMSASRRREMKERVRPPRKQGQPSISVTHSLPPLLAMLYAKYLRSKERKGEGEVVE